MSSVLRENQNNKTTYCTVEPGLGLPDSPSEAVLQRCGAYVKDVDLGKPGIDAGHLSNQRTARLKTNQLFDKKMYNLTVHNHINKSNSYYKNWI